MIKSDFLILYPTEWWIMHLANDFRMTRAQIRYQDDILLVWEIPLCRLSYLHNGISYTSEEDDIFILNKSLGLDTIIFCLLILPIDV